MRCLKTSLRRCAVPVVLSLVPLLAAAEVPAARKPPTVAAIVAASKPSDWKPLDPENTLYLQLPTGRVVIELAPKFAPQYVANIKTLVRERYFDGLAIERVQDDFVVQWGDPGHSKSLGAAKRSLPAEFVAAARDVPFAPLADPDTYAPQTGFSGDFPAARDPAVGRAWLVHCYGMVGAGRSDDVDSGNGSELYAVIGQAPRQLDRNVALVGRVVQGMELLAALPRGTGSLGFYTPRERRMRIESMKVAADVPSSRRSRLEVMRTDTRAFAELIEARRNRRDAWYKVPAGRADVCNIPIPVRRQ